ncbi:alpha/beta hydrolase [Gordonibacter sp.]|uniref:alpha/beta hydrolase n=1 Tax=Gordonibacter sp. TaxID=1968902 RepID=UPI002FC7D687
MISVMKQAESASTDPTAPQRRWPRRLAIAGAVLLLVVILAIGAFLAYAGNYYRDADTNHANLVSSEQVRVEQQDGYVAFGDPNAKTGLVFYPGAKVEYTSYAPLMRELAERGYLAVVVEMPFNFAFFNINAADSVRSAFPQVQQWWVGGHSLGGSMAAQYAADHAGDATLGGLVLLGSYTASDLSATDLGIIAVYGSNDHVLNRDKLASSKALMPPDALVVELPGGNHAQFGDYGAQDGDGEASIPPEQQQAETAEAIDAYVRTLQGAAGQ